MNLIKRLKQLPEKSKDRLARLIGSLLSLIVAFYRKHLAIFVGGNCRFYPSCSVYAEEALKTHRADRALYLIGKRVCKCHPLGGEGYDPVPPVNSQGKV